MRRKAGFTLIELMIVIVIIIVLASIAYPVWKKAKDSGNVATCQMNLHNIYLAVEQYKQDNGAYPVPPKQPAAGQTVMTVLVQAGKLAKILHCPDDPDPKDDSYGPLYNYWGYVPGRLTPTTNDSLNYTLSDGNPNDALIPITPLDKARIAAYQQGALPCSSNPPKPALWQQVSLSTQTLPSVPFPSSALDSPLFNADPNKFYTTDTNWGQWKAYLESLNPTANYPALVNNSPPRGNVEQSQKLLLRFQVDQSGSPVGVVDQVFDVSTSVENTIITICPFHTNRLGPCPSLGFQPEVLPKDLPYTGTHLNGVTSFSAGTTIYSGTVNNANIGGYMVLHVGGDVEVVTPNLWDENVVVPTPVSPPPPAPALSLPSADNYFWTLCKSKKTITAE